MRTYWLKILGGAFGVFAVGMVLLYSFRSVKAKVTSTLNSTDPIPIPLIGLVPFRLDSVKLGSLKRVEFVRSDPEHVSGVRVVINLGDSMAADRLRSCRIALDDADHINEGTTFRCQALEGGPAPGLVPFGQVVINGGGDSFPLLLPERAARDLRETTIKLDHQGLHVNGPHDAAAEAIAARLDSIQEELSNRIDARSDSVDNLKELAASLEDSATSLGAAGRRRVQRSADSVRAVMRAMVERMKADEARHTALQGRSPISRAELDSLTTLGPRIVDSVRRAIAPQIREAQDQARRARDAAAVSTPAAPAAPAPAPVAKPR